MFRKETKSKALQSKLDKSFISKEQVLIGICNFCPSSIKIIKITYLLSYYKFMLLDVKWLPFHWF